MRVRISLKGNCGIALGNATLILKSHAIRMVTSAYNEVQATRSKAGKSARRSLRSIRRLLLSLVHRQVGRTIGVCRLSGCRMKPRRDRPRETMVRPTFDLKLEKHKKTPLELSTPAGRTDDRCVSSVGVSHETEARQTTRDDGPSYLSCPGRPKRRPPAPGLARITSSA